ncbi:CLL_HP2_G0007920.mRNA.1.CDS.1 [Saccharomyces cerevisiae]|nr:CLL_HP2_G0007920.mRNA.1.CDS.1 [Saccharomyces cerevisiae]CAI6430011.1 CLL_HP2_G0007920.mRNA.1.CDS.1 [Saccharomyces cerevisiae]
MRQLLIDSDKEEDVSYFGAKPPVRGCTQTDGWGRRDALNRFEVRSQALSAPIFKLINNDITIITEKLDFVFETMDLISSVHYVDLRARCRNVRKPKKK